MVALLASLFLHSSLQPLDIMVDGVERHALVSYSRDSSPAPLIFAFHGHGGNMRYAARKYALESLWPQATIVYMGGLPTASAKVDPEGKYNGWQARDGGQNNRDLKFFDKALAAVRGNVRIDDRRIYAMGHSNGALFTYLLWDTHPRLFAAIGCVGGVLLFASRPAATPVIHIAAEQDTLVPYQAQLRTVERVKRINGCTGSGTPWEEAGCTIWPSSLGAPVVFYSYPGSHAYPDDASEKIIRFFKQEAKG